jgi:hypothetical protein
VDYGSELAYLINLEKLLLGFSKVNFIKCPVKDQLWNKSRAINIALKQTNNSYFIVGDIDLIFRFDFFETLNSLKLDYQAIYFQVGFLSEVESQKDKLFEDYIVNHFSSSEATGITLFQTHLLKVLNGYDEFYHGWGAEDTDVHIRMKNQGVKVFFYDSEILVKHQWHPKAYRSKGSTHPFHSQLERMNHAYMNQTEKTKRTKVNLVHAWGKLPEEKKYGKLKLQPHHQLNLDASLFQVNAFLAQLANFENETVQLTLKDVSLTTKIKNYIKRVLGKKYSPILDMEAINNRILEEIIKNYRNCPYNYVFDRKKNTISLTIHIDL